MYSIQKTKKKRYPHINNQLQPSRRIITIQHWKNDFKAEINNLQQKYSLIEELLRQGTEFFDYVMELSEELKNIKKLYESNTPQHSYSDQFDFINSRFHNLEMKIKHISEKDKLEGGVDPETEKRLTDIIVELRQLQKNYEHIQKISVAAKKLVEKSNLFENNNDHVQANIEKDTIDLVRELEKKTCWVYGTIKNDFLILHKLPNENTPTKLFYKKAQRVLLYYHTIRDLDGNTWFMTRTDADLANTYYVKFIDAGSTETNIQKLSVLQ
jgi:hypothetical protein